MSLERYYFRFKVAGTPRPRFSLHGGGVSVYMPSDYAKYQSAIASEYTRQGGKMHGGPVGIKIDVYRSLPRTKPAKVKSEPDVCKPDIDNIAKGFLDALTGVAYFDDRQVVSLSITKHPRERREDITIVEVIENEYNE